MGDYVDCKISKSSFVPDMHAQSLQMSIQPNVPSQGRHSLVESQTAPGQLSSPHNLGDLSIRVDIWKDLMVIPQSGGTDCACREDSEIMLTAVASIARHFRF